MATAKNPTVSANNLDDEPIAGRRLLVTFKAEEFEILDVMNDMDWEEAALVISDLSLERGGLNLKPALVKVLGSAQMPKLKGWSLSDVMLLSEEIGKRLGNALGNPGE